MALDTSVIITSFNRKAFIGRAIRSCLKQSLERERFEIIVVDDASTDGSQELLATFKEIRTIFLEKNVGVAEASNVGIREAQGSLVLRLDSDDYLKEHALLFMTEILLANPEIGFVYSDHFKVDEKERPLERVVLNTLDLLFRHGAGIMFRKFYLESIGLYDKEFRNAEDFDLLKRYIKNYDGYHLRLPLYNYRQHASNMTKDESERTKWMRKVLKKYENRK